MRICEKFPRTLDASGLENVKIHGFDNWDKTKIRLGPAMNQRRGLRKAVAILSNHTMADMPAPPDVRQLADTLNKPIWTARQRL